MAHAPNRKRGRPRSAEADTAAPIQALDRGLMVLAALAREETATLTELSLSVGLPPSTAHRILITLQRHGYVELDEATQTWMIGVESFRIGSSFLLRTNVVEAARNAMRHLMEATGETANLAIGDSGDVVFVSQVETHNPIRAFFRPGTRGPMHSSGIGKALLAEMPRAEVEKIFQRKGLPEFTAKTITAPGALFANLEETHARGWALDDEERYLGMRCVAAPIFNAHGEAIAGISVSGPTVRFPDRVVAEFGPRVRQAAAEVTRLIGGVGA
ncbi:IclR family acetate operon transcriptional repressor [Rubricella aquisinus]|uniref:IclR family acetate operon transcriptional repressor n=1 Tax=Rubricella aquisinus TaxID=2028108 RepID=A0A840WSE7_9RHOB|nr:HTH-type transcriptional regulator BhcR [Rubricella aquisinus]MBB5514130.1 IclR family acetate operon transcriptional repressor [Rubricella aquisinus]